MRKYNNLRLSDVFENEVVDIHNHSLFDIDDGAQNLETSVQMIKSSYVQGVKKVFLTPHINMDVHNVKEVIDDFLRLRDEKISILKNELEKQGIEVEIKAGAEVFCTRDIVLGLKKAVNSGDVKLEQLRRLCLGDSDKLLIEFSENVYPVWIDEIAEVFKEFGIGIIVAHMDRYEWTNKKVKELEKLHSKNVAFQINIDSCFRKNAFGGNSSLKLIKGGIVDYIASDSHNLNSRPQVFEKLLFLPVRYRKHFERLLYNNTLLW